MKIKKLHVPKYKHLKNLTFDFSYKQGEKKGKPLDKICFIGQSATGKTTLLELLFNQFETFNTYRGNIKTKEIFGREDLPISEFILEDNDGSFWGYENKAYLINKKKFTHSTEDFILPVDKNPNLYFISSEVINQQNLNIFTINISELLATENTFDNKLNLKNKISFGIGTETKIWISLLKENLSYHQNLLKFASEIVNTGKYLDFKEYKEKLDNWEKNNINPLKEFAEKFNILLEKINLEVDVNNTSTIIPLRNKITKEVLPIKNISTGTKQLLLTALPLYKLDTNNAIILIDEPERSLYPDMQMDLMEFYKSLAPNAQFIVATHSPFIAACFEPDERFILHFDEKGSVAVKRGESPIGDDPNDILKNDFKVNYFNKYGEEAYQKYMKLKQEVINESDEVKKKKLLLEVVELGNLYNF